MEEIKFIQFQLTTLKQYQFFQPIPMLYEDMLSHIHRQSSLIFELQLLEQQQHALNQSLSSTLPTFQLSFESLVHLHINLAHKQACLSNTNHELQCIETTINSMREQIKQYGEAIKEQKQTIHHVAHSVEEECAEEIQSLRKLGQQINAVAVVGQYLEQFVKGMGCEKPLNQLVAFIHDYYAVNIGRKFRHATNQLKNKYITVREQPQTQRTLNQVNSNIQQYENQLDAVMHQLHAANQTQMGIRIDQQILQHEVHQTKANLNEALIRLERTIQEESTIVCDVYANECGDNAHPSEIETILTNTVYTKLNEYLTATERIKKLREVIKSSKEEIKWMEHKLGLTDPSEYESQNSNSSNQQKLTLPTTCREIVAKKLGIFLVYRKMYITKHHHNTHNKYEWIQPHLQRTLQLHEYALTFKKQHPHFQQQIPIKRIKYVQVQMPNLIEIHFTKGYLLVYFVHDDVEYWCSCVRSNYSHSLNLL